MSLMNESEARDNGKYLEHSPYLTVTSVDKMDNPGKAYGLTVVDSFTGGIFKVISFEDVLELARLHNENRRQHRISPAWNVPTWPPIAIDVTA